MYSAGLRVDIVPALEDKALNPVLGQQCCGGEPGWAGAHDDHRDGFSHFANRTMLRCVPRSIAPSSVATLASTTSPSCRYLGLPAWRLKKAFHFRAGGSSDPMTS